MKEMPTLFSLSYLCVRILRLGNRSRSVFCQILAHSQQRIGFVIKRGYFVENHLRSIRI
jgi:hypothetical protein